MQISKSLNWKLAHNQKFKILSMSQFRLRRTILTTMLKISTSSLAKQTQTKLEAPNHSREKIMLPKYTQIWLPESCLKYKTPLLTTNLNLRRHREISPEKLFWSVSKIATSEIKSWFRSTNPTLTLNLRRKDSSIRNRTKNCETWLSSTKDRTIYLNRRLWTNLENSRKCSRPTNS